ncbi:MAG: N-acetylmuramoyl-L-alanine amidase [Lachnospiraceae bacterium]|nr:N-acetylmuramoyl-L-alanine amidase [Lachnospiraceae bacterium]
MRRNRRRRKPGRRIIALLIVIGIAVLGWFSVRFAIRMREQIGIEASEEAGASPASNAQTKEDEQADSLAEVTAASPEDAESAGELLNRQSIAANQENARVLKGVIAAAVPDVSTYAAALRGNAAGGDTRLVCLDPAHQASPMTETERIGPGLDERSQKMTVGAVGSITGKHEYEITLEIALKLREELIRRGYSVVMTRETNNAEVSEAERARTGFMSGADILVHISCGSSEDPEVNGVEAWEPTYESPSIGNSMIALSQRLAKALLTGLIASTGQEDRGYMNGDALAAFNWSEIPVATIQVGYISNADEEGFVTGYSGQSRIVTGIADGIDSYFQSLEE